MGKLGLFVLICVAPLHAAACPTFEQAVAEVYSKKPHLKPMVIKKRSNKGIARKNLNHSIDAAAVVYATLQVYRQYGAVFNKQDQSSGCANMVAWLYPAWLDAMSKKGKFIVGTVGIALETLVYKTVAQLFVTCLMGDVFESAQVMVTTITNMISSVKK